MNHHKILLLSSPSTEITAATSIKLGTRCPIQDSDHLVKHSILCYSMDLQKLFLSEMSRSREQELLPQWSWISTFISTFHMYISTRGLQNTGLKQDLLMSCIPPSLLNKYYPVLDTFLQWHRHIQAAVTVLPYFQLNSCPLLYLPVFLILRKSKPLMINNIVLGK